MLEHPTCSLSRFSCRSLAESHRNQEIGTTKTEKNLYTDDLINKFFVNYFHLEKVTWLAHQFLQDIKVTSYCSTKFIVINVIFLVIERIAIFFIYLAMTFSTTVCSVFPFVLLLAAIALFNLSIYKVLTHNRLLQRLT